MTNLSQRLDRDQVLSAFHEAYDKPSAENIIEWVKRYPEYAEDIREHAVITHDIAARGAEQTENDVEERAIKISFSHALNGLYAGDQKSKTAANPDAGASFRECLTALGKNIAALADEVGGKIGIDTGVVSDLVNGRMKPPIGRRFKEAVMNALSQNSASFDQTHQHSLKHPRLGMAKASGPPSVKQRSYDDIVKASNMDEKQIQYWLSED